MGVVVYTSIFAFILSVLTSKNRAKYGMEIAFIVLAFVGAIHYNYGNDYINYHIMYDEYSSLASFSPFDRNYFRDPGWVFLCRLCKPIGFFGMVILLNVVYNFVYYFLIKKYVSQKWYWFAMLIYLFSTNLYLINFSMMRQGLTVALFALTYPLIEKKKIFLALPIVIALTYVHTSAFILLPFVFWGYIEFRKAKLTAFIYLGIFVLFLLGGSIVNSVMSFAFSIDEIRGAYNVSGSGLQFGIGFLAELIPFTLSLLYLCNDANLSYNKRMVALATVSSVLIPFQQQLVIAGRLGFYFAPISMLTAFLIYGSVKEKTLRFVFLGVFIALIIYRYQLFFSTGPFAESYSEPFRTIFEVPWQ